MNLDTIAFLTIAGIYVAGIIWQIVDNVRAIRRASLRDKAE